jgi:hypothetical protein
MHCCFPSPDRSSPLFFDDASIDAHPRLGFGVASRLARHSALVAHGFGSSRLSRGSGFDATAPPRSTSGFDAASARSGSGFDAAAPPRSTSGFDASPARSGSGFDAAAPPCSISGFDAASARSGSGFDAAAPPRSTSGFDAASARSGSGFDAAAPPRSTSGFDAAPARSGSGLDTTALMFGVQEPMSPPVSTPLGCLVVVLLLLALLSLTTQLSSSMIMSSTNTLIVVVMPRTTPLRGVVEARLSRHGPPAASPTFDDEPLHVPRDTRKNVSHFLPRSTILTAKDRHAFCASMRADGSPYSHLCSKTTSSTWGSFMKKWTTDSR